MINATSLSIYYFQVDKYVPLWAGENSESLIRPKVNSSFTLSNFSKQVQ